VDGQTDTCCLERQTDRQTLAASLLHRLQGVLIEAECAEAGIKGFPSWVVGGQIYEGEQTFQQLEAALAKAAADSPVPAEP
jgi:2-hydroxychromene-2-carboxylate isomerase